MPTLDGSTNRPIAASATGKIIVVDQSIIGSFHKVSLKHIDRFLEELEWRFNDRSNPRIFTDTLRRILTTNALPYRDLVDKAA